MRLKQSALRKCVLRNWKKIYNWNWIKKNNWNRKNIIEIEKYITETEKQSAIKTGVFKMENCEMKDCFFHKQEIVKQPISHFTLGPLAIWSSN